MKISAILGPRLDDPFSIVMQMADAQRLVDFQTIETYGINSGAIACVRTADRFSSIDLLRRSAKENLLLISGVPFSMQDNLDACLDEILNADADLAAVKLRELDGAFCAFHWDNSSQLLTVVTDPLGAQPLYWARVDRCILVASELKAFPASGLVDVRMDRGGWGAFVSLGFNVGRRCQLDGVHRIDAATVLTIEPESGAVNSTVYWHWPTPQPDMSLGDVDFSLLLDIMEKELRGYQAHKKTATTLLSGGFDSRIIMSSLKRAGIHSPALTVVNHKELSGAESKISIKVSASMNNGDLTVAEPSTGFYSSPDYLRYLVMNEVAIPSLDLFIAKVWQFLRPEIHAVWEGVMPGYGFAPPYPAPGGFSGYRSGRVKPADSLAWQIAMKTFAKPDSGSMHEEFELLLQEEIDSYADDEFGVNQFQLNNQMRRRLGINPCQVLANYVLPFTPCISKDFWNIAGALPLSVRGDKKLYKYLLKEYFPDALKVPVCSGGELYSPRAIAPLLLLKEQKESFNKRLNYYMKRLPRLPLVRNISRKMSRSIGADINQNLLVANVVRSINPEHPEVNADMVRIVQDDENSQEWPVKLSRSMLFYWQVWHWVMEGRLTTWNADSFHGNLFGQQDEL